MTVYTTSALSTRVIWPEPIEQIWQVLPSHAQSSLGRKRPDLGLSERLFIGAVLNLPKERRRWGLVTWLASVLNISRPSLYAIGERTKGAMTTFFVFLNRAKNSFCQGNFAVTLELINNCPITKCCWANTVQS
jgi:hypothetical protein